jgi:CRP/FNR family transcriptional regulator, cyclic AMP receptor protein
VESVALLEAEPALAAALDRQERRQAERTVRAPALRLETGRWRPPRREAAAIGYLLYEGMLLRRVLVEGGSSVELLGPGDCLLPWQEEGTSFARAEWQALEASRLAVVDLRQGSTLSRWPAISAAILDRAVARSRALAVQAAIMSMVGTEARLHTLLWALAERWGRAAPGGVELEVRVPQSVLAEMVGARRQTVNTALSELRRRGALTMPAPGHWLLLDRPPGPVS